MIRCGLTGGIGSGKSMVCRILEVMGVPVFYADPEAKKYYRHKEVIQNIRQLFGETVISRGEVNLKVLGKMAFSDKEVMNKLNALLHPKVMRDFALWTEKHHTAKYEVLESAIIFEAQLEKEFDYIISVYAPPQLCIQRIMQRDNLPEEEAEMRINSQYAPEKKAEMADFVIYNDEQQMLIPQLFDIHYQILKMNSQ